MLRNVVNQSVLLGIMGTCLLLTGTGVPRSATVAAAAETHAMAPAPVAEALRCLEGAQAQILDRDWAHVQQNLAKADTLMVIDERTGQPIDFGPNALKQRPHRQFLYMVHLDLSALQRDIQAGLVDDVADRIATVKAHLASMLPTP